MSRYLQGLVMRSLGEAGGLVPRPMTRYETVRHGSGPDLTERIHTMEGMNGPLEYGRLFQAASSQTIQPMTEIGRTEDVVQPGGQTDAHSRNDPGGASTKTRRAIRPGIPSEGIEDVEVWKDERAVTVRRPMEQTRTSRHVDEIRPMNREIPSEEGDGAFAHAAQATVASPEREGLRATERAELAESAPPMRNGVDQPVDQNHSVQKNPPPPLVRDQERSSDPLRPTLGEVSLRRLDRQQETTASVGERPAVVQIRIGRIEVRAVEQPVPVSNKKVAEPQRSSLPLDQYLRRRSREA